MSIIENGKFIPRTLTDLGITDGAADEVLLTDGAGNFSFGTVIASEEAQRIVFNANAGEALVLGDPVYISGVSGSKPVVSKADCTNAAKMPAFGVAGNSASLGSNVEVVTFGTLHNIDTSTPGWALNNSLYVGASGLQTSKPAGESSLVQNLAKVQRVHVSNGSIKIGGAGRTNDVPNLNKGNIFIGNASNLPSVESLDTLVSTMADTKNWTVNVERIELPEAPGITIEYIGWYPFKTELVSAGIYCDVVNTVGSLQLDIENVAAGVSSLPVAFDMNSLTANTVTNIPLSAVLSSKQYLTNNTWKITLASNNVGMNGSGFYLVLGFKPIP